MNSHSANIWSRLISAARSLTFKKEIIKYFEEEDQKKAALEYLALLDGGESSCEVANFFYKRYVKNTKKGA